MILGFWGREFDGFNTAKSTLGEMGLITGPMQRDDPVAVVRKGRDVKMPGKWRHCDDAFKKNMTGVILGKKREGPLTVIIFDEVDKNPY